MESIKQQTLKISQSTYRWIAYESINSTNSACLNAAREGDAGNLWISSNCQSAGRGRGGRQWVSEIGNLYASILLINPMDRIDQISQLALLSVVSLGDAVYDIFGRNKLNLGFKWPNDLVVEGSKIAGILLESENQPNGKTAIVVGFGVNCNTHPDHLLYPATNLAALGCNIQPGNLFRYLVEKFDSWLQIWNKGKNFESIRNAWLENAVGLSQDITIQLPNHSLTGNFIGIDANGYLELKLPNGNIKNISAGDVFLPNQLKETKSYAESFK